jgi:Phosphoesterase family
MEGGPGDGITGHHSAGGPARRSVGDARAWWSTVVVALALFSIAAAAPPTAVAHSRPALPHHNDGLGIRPGKIKHVWLIILENKSYDATFTGLNRNTYLWRTLPAQGVLLKNYFGTGHFSFDNYISLVSGQATQADTQVDCPYYDHFSGHVDRSGSLRHNPNYGQMTSAQGPNAAAGENGCVYPPSVKTLFNQFDSAHVSWKGYAQDLGYPSTGAPNPSAGVRVCGAPFRSPGPTGSKTQPNPSVANATDQYLPKHFPFPWFESILKSGQCSHKHIASLFGRRHGLFHDLRRKATTPAFSWITPNMCSDGHDAVCHGNNLSGGFTGPNTPRKPRNYTGGLYAADLFLRHIVPAIERSPAYRDGGLIDITFDEAFPPFTFTANSFANSKRVAPDAATSIANDSAGETLFGRSVHFEPTGPNTPLAKNALGQELYPGPGDNAFVDRPSICVAQTVPPRPKRTCLLGGGGHVPGPRTDAGATAPMGGSTISDNSIVITDTGRSVTGTGIPVGAFVGKVTNTPVMATAPNQDGGFVVAGSFVLVDSYGRRLLTTGAVKGITVGPRTPATDPLFNATSPTTGGGDTGSVLISPYIKPGTVSKRFYNHYSWLRTMEDLFGVARFSRGLDHAGHLGYAAQPGLAPFGRDVFNSPLGYRIRSLATPDIGRIVQASPAEPQVAIQGDTVAVALGSGRGLATVVGPAVARSGLSPAPISVQCTFTVRLSARSGTLPLSAAGFAIVDEQGQLHRPSVSAVNDTRLPTHVAAGRSVTLTLRAELPVGGGRISWTPQGPRPTVSWDFDVEID